MGQKEVSGSVMAGVALMQREMLASATALYTVSGRLAEDENPEAIMTSLRIRCPEVRGGDYLVIVGRWYEGQFEVGFHSEGSLHQAFVGALNRIRNGSMRFKPDDYRNKAE